MVNKVMALFRNHSLDISGALNLSAFQLCALRKFCDEFSSAAGVMKDFF
jgi:hypothetical protein